MSDVLSPANRPPAPPPRLPPAGAPNTSSLTGVVIAVVVVLALYFGRVVLIPITLAMLLSFVLAPLVELLRRLWLGRILSVLLAVMLALGIVLALGTAIGTQVAHLSANVPQYERTIENKLHYVRDVTVNRLSGKIENIGQKLSRAAQSAANRTPATGGPAAQRQPVPVVVTQPAPSALEIGEAVISPLLSPLATAGIILVVTIFALLQKEDLRDRMIRLFGSKDLRRTTVAMTEAGRRLSRYFLTQLGINTSFGAIVAAGLYFIGVPDPVLWGILGALLRFVPYVGSWIAALLSTALAMAVTPGWSMVIWTVVLYAATELTIGQAVEPLVYGHSTGLTPIAVIIAAIFWTWMWGPIGLIISTPVTLCLVVLGRHVERLEFLDVLLGDRPALSPAEGFYQRILADDPDEAEAQAEGYLEERQLSSYYDEVALKGLQLAAYDVVRGTLSAAQIDRIRTTIRELIDDLERYDDVPQREEIAAVAGATIDQRKLPAEPPPNGSVCGKPAAQGELAPKWQPNAVVLCIAGREPLDEIVASMLDQLLRKHGLKTRFMPNENVSRANIRSLDSQEVAMVCIAYLEISGNPAHLRYLLARLRERVPGVPLLIGLWPPQDPIQQDGRLRQLLGADYYVSTLYQAVEACLAEAHGTAAPKQRGHHISTQTSHI
ncbi:MAG: AI-2E family transporter [Steroidobacteraceae bacterium]